VFCAHASGNQLDSIRTSKSRPAFLKTTLSLTIDKKTIRVAAIPRSLCLSLSPAVSKNHWQSIRSRESSRGCIARRRIQKEEEEHASN